MKIDMSVDLGKFRLKNPVMTASGTFGYGYEYNQLYDISRLGAVVVKGIAPFVSNGNPTPRVAETASGMLNAIGLQGPGVDKFLHGEHYMPFLRTTDATVIVNIWGKSIADYCEVAERLDAEREGITALEVNISCPNVKAGGVAFGTDTKLLDEVISAVRKSTTLPLIVKLSPNVTDIVSIAKACEDAGADGISLINTMLGMRIDLRTRKPVIANKMGGFSGSAIFPVAVRMVYQVAHAVSIPVVGMGGVSSAEDVIEMMLAGATAVEVGAANLVNP